MITPRQKPLRIGAVSYLNTLPLIDGIECNRQVELVLDVPARLAGRLVQGETDLSLCSVIDHQHQDDELALRPLIIVLVPPVVVPFVRDEVRVERGHAAGEFTVGVSNRSAVLKALASA